MLISGGGGFIGINMALFLAQKKENEIVLVENFWKPQSQLNWSWLKPHHKNIIELIDTDILHTGQDFFSREEFDVVIHCAAQTAVTYSLENPGIDFDMNLKNTVALLEYIRRSKIDPKILFCSTNKVYGTNVENIETIERETRHEYWDAFYLGVNEEMSVDQCIHSPYGASKLGADLYMQEYHHAYGLKTGVFRMSCIYGPNQFGTEDQGWLAHFVFSFLKNQPIHVYGDGKQVRDILYIDDLINVFNAFINSKLNHGIFNIGGGMKNTLSLRELINMLEIKVGKRVPYMFEAPRIADQKIYISDITKAQTLLNWTPQVSPNEGIDKLITWAKKTIG